MQFRLVLAAALAAAPIATARASDCGSLRSEVQAATEAQDTSALKELFVRAGACDPAYADWLGRRVASLEYAAAMASTPVDETRLMNSLVFGRPWQTLATLGDLAAARKDRTAAARHFQDALVEIDDVVRTPTAPDAQTIAAIRKKAEVAALLADSYVAMPKARDGSTSGLGAVSVRGVAVTTTALPIWFEFGKSEFSPEGRKAVEEVIEMLRARPPGVPVTLVGHTDAVGDAAFNRRLSLQRAQRVKDHIVAKGVSVPIKVEGKGEDEPYVPDDVTKYTSAELEQMSRRVQLIFD